jgi:hypothetical protein
MAVNLTYDPANDPDTIEAEDQRDAESLEIGEKLAEEQEQLLAGKYKDAEELESAYIELQKKLGSNKEKTEEEDVTTEDKVEETEDETKEENPFDDDVTAQAIFQASNEFDENGEITEETMKSLSEMDSKDLVEAYYKIQKYAPEATAAQNNEAVEPTPLSDESITEIQNAVGGADAYTNMTSWAQDNFTPDEIQAYDQALESGNLNNINFALQALYYRYTDSVGSEGEMIQGKSAATVDGFRSQQEVVRAMNDPRYENDPAYRQDVYEKLERSQLKF